MPRPAMPRWVVAAIVGLFFAGGAAVAGWTVELPYYAFSPGPVGDALGAVHVAEGTAVHPPAGELFMLTVAAQPLNAFELLAAGLDPTVDVVRRELIQGPDESDEEFTRRQLALMDDSIATAMAVAFDRLGIDLPSDGVRVVAVDPGFPAADVLEPGDVFREVDGDEVAAPAEVARALADREPGDVVEIVVDRRGATVRVDAELGSVADEPGRALLGVRIGPYFVDAPATIDPENVGGPSAGLMYTLAIIELLSGDDLTGGRVIAGTGTIEPDGSVGAIGGIRQKVVAAEAAGAEVMLVPSGNYPDALAAPHERIDLVSVTSVDEALELLAGVGAG